MQVAAANCASRSRSASERINSRAANMSYSQARHDATRKSLGGIRVVCLLLLLTFAGCHVNSRRAVEAKLTGRWGFVGLERCKRVNIQSDYLVLHEDRSFEQHTTFTNGQRADSTAGSWEYLDNFKIQLRSWLDVVHGNPTSDSAPRVTAVLSVDLRHPAVLFDPQTGGCFYTQPK